MFDFGCHRIEVLLNVFGGIGQLKAVAANVAFSREVEDTAVAIFQFERGTCGVLSVTHACREPADTLDIFGSRGSLHVPALNEGKMRVVTEKGERAESHPPADNLHAPLLEDFVDAVFENREPKVNGEIGRRVAIIEEKIYGPALS
jgi:predicted dehydrogenase